VEKTKGFLTLKKYALSSVFENPQVSKQLRRNGRGLKNVVYTKLFHLKYKENKNR
jgi:hypothetical protein